MRLRLLIVTAVALALPGAASGHDLLDHNPPTQAPQQRVGTTFNSGGPGAKWELLTTILTGNPHTDLDFFTRGGDTYASVGTLAAGPNSGGQTIVRLTEGSEVKPSFVAGHPSADCGSDPAAALGLQHDSEATPKRNAQLVLDATDNEGRCHDGGATFGLGEDVKGGLEIVDITNPADPVEIGLTSHIGEAHTVNVDPKRPHIAFAVTSDSVNVTCDEARITCTRANESPASAQRFNLDGFELVDLSSCLDFPTGTTTDQKRAACRPKVYRYRYASPFWGLGHTAEAVAGCHELEISPDDKLTCAGIHATLLFDLSGAFDDNGTPTNYADDKPRGTPLPCRTRPSSTLVTAEWYSGAVVTDCVYDAGGGELTIPRWQTLGSPSLEGVRFLGSAFHQGRGAPHPSSEDVDVSHEAELTHSGRFLLATDERGGGVTPPGATCAPAADNPQGNGGIHAYAVDRLLTSSPDTAEEAWVSYARTPSGAKAIHRAEIHTQPQSTLCTSHVFHQIPGQNRIFMGWYSQGTQVVDYVEHPNGTIEFKPAGWFIPENANTWVSAVFKFQQNPDCTFTYWGATGDFNLAAAGRNAIDVYKVTLPPPPSVVCTPTVSPPPPPPPPPPGAPAAPPPARTPAASPCTLNGTSGNDRLTGTPRPDVICGRGGNDTISGLGGNDRLYGGAGNDRLLGGAGKDRLFGGPGADRVYGGAAADLLAGDGGNDRLYAGSGANRLLGKAGRDLLWARNRTRDRIAGGSGLDRAVVDRFDFTKYIERLLRG